MAIWSLKEEKFLVIDDFAEMRSMLRSMLMSYGARDIQLVRNGEDALKALEKEQFTFVLCDYNLGDGKDGQQVLEEAKYRHLLPASLVFVMVTAENTSHMVMGALECQPDSYLTKPINRTVLQARLASLMKKRDRLYDLNQYIDQKRYLQAIEACDKELAASPKYRFELLKLRAELLMRLGEYAAVVEQAQQVLDEREIPWAFYYLGEASLKLEDYTKAKQIFQRLIDEQANYMVAYDGLAEAEKGLGNDSAAQDVLLKAIERSPKSVLRQRELAETSEGISDFRTSEVARREAVRVGRMSALKEPGDYSGLAKVLIRNDKSDEALKVTDSLQKVFDNSAAAELTAVVTSSLVYKSMGKKKESEVALNESLRLVKHYAGGAPRGLILDVAEACMLHGQIEQAQALIKEVVCEQHNDKTVLARIDGIFKDAGLQQQGLDFVEKTRQEIIQINNHGVTLASEGDIQASILLFEEALSRLPKNTDININAAFAYLKSMQLNGLEQGVLNKAKRCLAVVGLAGDHVLRFQKLMKLSRDMEASLSRVR